MKTRNLLLMLMICTLTSACNTRTNKSAEPTETRTSEVAKTKTQEEILKAVANAKETIALRYGTSFGMCQGYCLSEMEVTSKGIKHVRSDWPSREGTVVPITTGLAYTVEEYDALLAKLDLDAFFKMDTVYGCPDCADGGAEWIEISRNGTTQKVTIEFGKKIEGLTGVMAGLRKLSESVPRPK